MPVTFEKYQRSLKAPALAEQLKIRDLLDGVAIQLDGSFVAGYELSGLNSYYASDEQRNRTKGHLEALVRSLPEHSMQMQVRFEISEGTGGVIDGYKDENRNESPVLQALDRDRVAAWRAKDTAGFYLRHFLHAYFIWDPRLHHQQRDSDWSQRMSYSFSAKKCIERSRQEHEDLLAEFESLLAGVEATLYAGGMGARRMTHDEIFLEIKRALNPLVNDTHPYREPGLSLFPESARSQMANVNIEDETDDYLKIGGLLYSWVTLKDLPDATFQGLLRELAVVDFPIVVNAQVGLPDHAEAVKRFKKQLRKMTAAQRDIHGGFRLDMDAQVAQGELMQVLNDLISSSLRACSVSVIVSVRTSRPARNRQEMEEAERVQADRRQRVLHAMARMNGARGILEDAAKKRLFFSGLPAMADHENFREHDALTLHGADLLPVEAPWAGTPNSPLMLFETPYRQLIAFSPFDPSLADANVLIIGGTGSGKTFMAQQMLLMMARANSLISILERGDSYEPLVQLMGGRVISVDLEGTETLNPWDLPAGEIEPTREKISFLKSLTRHMVGETPGSDSSLLDSVLTDAIARTYKRRAAQLSNPIPTFSDLRDELAQWRDEERNERAMDEARLAALKLRQWTGEKGIYSKLFDAPTTMRLENNWLFFNVEELGKDPRLETAMSMVIANAVSERAAGKTGRPSITVLDECWFLLDSPALAPEVVQLFRTARKRNSSVWGISQTVEDFVGTETEPRPHGPGILKNSSTKIIGKQLGSAAPLAEHLFLNPTAIYEIKQFGAPRKGQGGEALLVLGEKAETTQTIRIVPTPAVYWVSTTFPRERRYRHWYLRRHEGRSRLDLYQELGAKFPYGLADAPPLPEEVSRAVDEAWAENGR
ncbi:MAG: VirB4 family type IV secretion system protein [Terriglobia bacterium]